MDNQNPKNEHGLSIDELIERRWRRPKRLEGKPLTFSVAQRQGYLLSLVGRITEGLRHDLVTDDGIVRGWSLYEGREFADVEKIHDDLAGMFTFALLRYEQTREDIEKNNRGALLDVGILYETTWVAPTDTTLEDAFDLLTTVALEKEHIVESLSTLVRVTKFVGLARGRFDVLMTRKDWRLMF